MAQPYYDNLLHTLINNFEDYPESSNCSIEVTNQLNFDSEFLARNIQNLGDTIEDKDKQISTLKNKLNHAEKELLPMKSKSKMNNKSELEEEVLSNKPKEKSPPCTNKNIHLNFQRPDASEMLNRI